MLPRSLRLGSKMNRGISLKPMPIARLVAVIASRDALTRARHLRVLPDFFELRLDAFQYSLGQVTANISQLRAPLILTARHPEEGGLGKLSLATRRALLSRFLDSAALVDLELRSLRQEKKLIAELQRRKIGLLISSHNFGAVPTLGEMHRLTRRAIPFQPAIFKLVTRTDTVLDFNRLATFLVQAHHYPFPIAVMGVGKLGRFSRRQFDRAGSALTYVSLGEANVEGQLSLGQLRRARRAYNK